MAQRSLVYYFTLLSPWSYLGHAPAMDLAMRHGLSVEWRPMSLSTIFPESGGLPLAKRHPKRRAYRDIELQRWRLARGVTLNLRPAFWPIDIGLADRTIIALTESGADPDTFVRAAFAALWANQRNLADEATIAQLLTETGHAPALAEAARAPGTITLYESNTRAALDAGVFGAPTYILDGEPFWGQDRLPLLEDALSSGRAPFTDLEAVRPD